MNILVTHKIFISFRTRSKAARRAKEKNEINFEREKTSEHLFGCLFHCPNVMNSGDSISKCTHANVFNPANGELL